MTMLRAAGVMTVGVWCVTNAVAAQAGVPTIADFQGDWTIAKVVGSSPGGVTAEKPSKMIGQPVVWNDNRIKVSGKICELHDAAVRIEPNSKLQDSIWGGQTIGGLTLSASDAAQAFGPSQTPVFEDRDGCAYAIQIDHDRIIMTFPSGYIYLLERSAGHN